MKVHSSSSRYLVDFLLGRVQLHSEPTHFHETVSFHLLHVPVQLLQVLPLLLQRVRQVADARS